MYQHILGIRFLLVLCFCSIVGITKGQAYLQQRVNSDAIHAIAENISAWRVEKLKSWKSALATLPDTIKEQIVKEGEFANSYEWPSLKAMVFLDYKFNGNRTNYEGAANARRRALGNLMKAELLEDKGRFIPQIINGLWLILEESTWVSPAHLPSQKLGIGLPHAEDPYIDLGAGRQAVEVALAYFFFHEAFDKVSKQINVRIRHELERRIIQPYLERDDYWWMTFHQTFVNNWNIWINTNVLKTFLLIEEDSNRLEQGLQKIMLSADKFVDFYPEDGACEEGPSYWMHAGGELGMMLNWLRDVSSDRISFADVPKMKNIGMYILNTHITGNRYINFADANAIENVSPLKVWNFYELFGDPKFGQFAAYLAAAKNHRPARYALPELLEYAVVRDSLNTKSSHFVPNHKFYYESLGQVIFNNKTKKYGDVFFSVIGSHNDVSHNHNDVGSYMLYYNGAPVLIDVGVGTYNAQTFSSRRYELWNMQSQWHNLPVINGVQQKEGKKFKARNVKTYVEGRTLIYSLNIAEAYPEEAAVNSWMRTFRLDTVINHLRITEKYDLKERKGPQQLVFVTKNRPIVQKGNLRIALDNGSSAILNFATHVSQVRVEEKIIEDNRIAGVWGDKLYRTIVEVEAKQLKGDIVYTLSFETGN